MKQRKRKSPSAAAGGCGDVYGGSGSPRKRNATCPWDSVPPEVAGRVLHLLTVQDLFRLRRVDQWFKQIVDNHLATAKMVSFSTEADTIPWAEAAGRVTDNNITAIFSHFPRVEEIRGLTFNNVNFRRVTR